MTVVERRKGEMVELRLPYLDKLEMQAITQKQKLSLAETTEGQNGFEHKQHTILLKTKKLPEHDFIHQGEPEDFSLFKRRQ